MKFEVHHQYQPRSILQQSVNRLHAEITELWDYTTPIASVYLPLDPSSVSVVQSAIAELSSSETMVIIGIWGSNLGTLAVAEALGITENLLFLDTVDLNDYQKQMQRVHGLLAEGGSLVVNCISKSGSTLETLSLAHAVYTDIGEHPRVRFMVTTDTGSKLEALALKQGWLVANLPQMVGGRYSVLSSVGLIPLGFVGISTEEIIEGARDSIHHFLANPTEHPASRVAEILFCAYEEGRNVFEHFFYAKRLESLGKWYRQLLAESVGKIRPDGTHVGVTPTTLIGTTDLHSVAQLQLAHPSDRVLAQVSLRETQDVSYTSQTPFTQLLGDCAKATLPEIMHAANIGNAQAWLSKGGPYISYELESSPRDIGYFLQTKMLEVILLGYMMWVNPFDQPNVEEYKVGMRAALVQ